MITFAPGRRTNETAEPKEEVLKKRIGSTVFVVSVHFNAASTERLEDKILRLIEREVRESA
jgi:hypothetical protein